MSNHTQLTEQDPPWIQKIFGDMIQDNPYEGVSLSPLYKYPPGTFTIENLEHLKKPQENGDETK